MAIRPTLKSYFVTNNIPTEDNFQEFIDSSLMQTEDGIRKPADGPVELAAQETTGEVLRLYASFEDKSPALWTVSHKPGGKGKAAKGGPGLNIADAQGSRLFIKTEDGNVGIGTTAPAQKLDVEGGIAARANGAISNQGAHLQWNRTGGDGETWLLNQKGGGNDNAGIRFGGANQDNKVTEWARFNDKGYFGIGTNAPNSLLSISPNAVEPKITFWDGGNATNHYGMGVSNGQLNYHIDGAGAQHVFYAGGKNGDGTELLRIKGNGNVGIGTDKPRGKLDVRGGDIFLIDDPNNSKGQSVFLPGHLFLAPYAADNGNAFIQARIPNPTGTTNIGMILRATNGGQLFDALNILPNGNVGIGTGSPEFPLDVRGSAAMRNSATYTYQNGATLGSGFTAKLNDVSIRASNRVVAAEFNANSDARLKTVLGRSDSAADLALLRRLRITDYTMRDRVQFGDRVFKKIIGQELEEVFPQVVHQNAGFLPDVYASASQVQLQGEYLRIDLPAGLSQAAAAGQRLKLMGPAGEVLATLAEPAAAGSQQLLVTGADALADSPSEVFVFGLEHADVRSVDYEAVSMLNVSATQALARQVEELHQQNTALNEQNQAQRAQLDELQAALQRLTQQVAHLLPEPSSIV